METGRKRALIFVNAAAGTGKAGSHVLQIAGALGAEGYEPVLYPVLPGTEIVPEKLIEADDGQTELIVCAGGDGTLNHVVESVMKLQKKPCLAYIPAGSTNDFAKGLGIEPVFSKALETAVHGEDFRYDVGKLNERYFNYVAAFGAFSAVSYATDQQLKNSLGHAAYILSAMAELPQNLNYHCHMKMIADEDLIEGDFLFGAVCNTVSVGGFDLFKDAGIRLDDGRMELLLIRTPKTPLELQGIISALLKGTFDHPLIVFRKIRKAEMTADSRMAWSLDGEFGGEYEKMVFQVCEQAVTIRAGKTKTLK